MSTFKKRLEKMQQEPNNVRFSELYQVCEKYFGEARQKGSSHVIFKTPWAGDPRINIQNAQGKAKAYQVKQVLLAIKKLKRVTGEQK